MDDYAGELHRPLYNADVLANALNNGDSRPLLQMPDGTVLSARDVRDATSQYQQALQSVGLGSGSRVGLLSPNRAECLHVAHAVQMLGGIYVPLHTLASLDDHLAVVRDANVDLLIFDVERFSRRAEEIVAAQEDIRLLAFGTGTSASDLISLAQSFEPEALVPPRLSDHDVMRLGYSGGTTGKPKSIPSTARTASVTGQIMQAEWEWPSPPRILTCAPLSHAGAAMFMPALLRSGTLLVLDGFHPERVLATIQDHKINCMLMVPTMIYAMLDCPSFDDYDLSSLETVFYGASAIAPARLQEAIRRIGPVFAQFYGQAEAPMCITYFRKSDHDVSDLRRLSSCGKPSPWIRMALLDPSGDPVADGQPGEICVRGPLVMDGYGDPSLNVDALRGGWLHTGDVAIRDNNGFIYIVDRIKDMIVSGGFNIFPREIEDIIAEHSAVAQVAVVGTPHPKWGEAITAIVVQKPGRSVEAEELIALVAKRKGSFQAPKSVRFMPSIPTTAVGKPDKKALKVQLAADYTE